MKRVLLKVSHIRQSEDGQCVPICAVMALAHMGIEADYERVARLMGTALVWNGGN